MRGAARRRRGAEPPNLVNHAVLENPLFTAKLARLTGRPGGTMTATNAQTLAGTPSLLHGTADPPAPMRALRAGPVSLLLDGIDLRYLRIGGTELVRRVYAAVRDVDWDTVPAVVSGLEVETPATASASSSTPATHAAISTSRGTGRSPATRPDGSRWSSTVRPTGRSRTTASGSASTTRGARRRGDVPGADAGRRARGHSRT